MRDLIPWPGMDPRPPAFGAWILSHWTTRKVPPIHSSVAPPTRQETPMASKQPNPGAGFLLWCLKTWLTAQFSWLCLFVTCGLFNTHFPCRLHCKAFLSWFSSFCSDHYFWVPLISSILSFNHFFQTSIPSFSFAAPLTTSLSHLMKALQLFIVIHFILTSRYMGGLHFHLP